ncbi:MAG: hypothetical protein GY754_25135 [bacterium]|nr:hypothetical protein [bacterium]
MMSVNSISSNNIIIGRISKDRVLVQKKVNPDPAKGLSESEKSQVDRLRKRDKDVRVHEGSHTTSSGVRAIGGPRYTYAMGPDGKPYAIGGEVTIVVGASSTANDAISKARDLRNAALSTGSPSPQDMAAASAANDMELEALAHKARENKQNTTINYQANNSFSPNPRKNAMASAINAYQTEALHSSGNLFEKNDSINFQV